MEDQITQISELFAAPKGDLQKVLNYGGVTFYTSTVLKQNFIKAISKNSRTAPIASTVLKLIIKNEFVPCYLTDKIYKSILKKQPPQFKGFVGRSLGKYIYIFVENDTNIFGFASNNDLSITTVHELIHKAAYKFKTKFISTFKIEFITFYKNYWEQLFMVKNNRLDVKTVWEIINFLYKNTEMGNRNNKSLIAYHQLLMEKFRGITTLNQDEFQKMVTAYIVLIKIIWKGTMADSPSLIEKAVFANRNIIVPLYTAYKMSFGISAKRIDAICYQELFAPSEVIATLSILKQPSQKIYGIVNKL